MDICKPSMRHDSVGHGEWEELAGHHVTLVDSLHWGAVGGMKKWQMQRDLSLQHKRVFLFLLGD